MHKSGWAPTASDTWLHLEHQMLRQLYDVNSSVRCSCEKPSEGCFSSFGFGAISIPLCRLCSVAEHIGVFVTSLGSAWKPSHSLAHIVIASDCE